MSDNQPSKARPLPLLCFTCAFYAYGIGRCQRFPPKPAVNGEYDGNEGFPEVEGHEWCGEHRALSGPALEKRLFDILDVSFGLCETTPPGVPELFPLMVAHGLKSSAEIDALIESDDPRAKGYKWGDDYWSRQNPLYVRHSDQNNA
jgi:hypothetical protein